MRCGIFVATLVLAGQPIFAQQVVQQPVVGVASVNTTVSVPDRGTMFLGGTSSAQSGRSQYGPLPTGPSTGLTRQATSMSVSVYIHDPEAMDEALLNSAPATSDGRRAANGITTNKLAREATPAAIVSPAEKATRFEELARKADEAGKPGVARLHWQMAAKYGSKVAEEKLAGLAQPKPSQLSRTAAR